MGDAGGPAAADGAAAAAGAGPTPSRRTPPAASRSPPNMAAPDIVKGALFLNPDVWRERAAMDTAAAASARCALSGVEVVRPPLPFGGGGPFDDAPAAAVAPLPAVAPPTEDDAHVATGAPADNVAQVDHVIECWLLSTLIDFGLRELTPRARKVARQKLGGGKSTLRKSFHTDGPNARLFLVFKAVANSPFNLAVLHPDAHAAKTAFFQNDVRPAVLGALKAPVLRGNAPYFPSFYTIRMDVVAAGKKAPLETHVRLWSILYATFANELWQLAQMVAGGLHEEDLRTAFFVAQRLNALGAGPGGDVFSLPDIRHLGQLARAAKRTETDDPQKLGPEGSHTADGEPVSDAEESSADEEE